MADKTEKKSKGFFAGVKRFFGRIGKFFRDTVSEMKKVVWPTGKEMLQYVLVTFAFLIVLTALVWGVDTLAGLGVRSVLGK